MTKLGPEWVRTSDPVIRSPARYRWTTAPALHIIRYILGAQLGGITLRQAMEKVFFQSFFLFVHHSITCIMCTSIRRHEVMSINRPGHV